VEVDEEPEGSGCAGAAVIAAAALGFLCGVYAVSPEAFVLGLWALAGPVWGGVYWWRAKHVPGTANPAPPPLSERGCEEEPQVTMVRDTKHRNRWVVARMSRWMTEEIDKEAGTT
jgi:hypothetical protein